MCLLSDQKDFWICHHIREKRCATLLLWTRGHTVACQIDLLGQNISTIAPFSTHMRPMGTQKIHIFEVKMSYFANETLICIKI